jgi:hypothetical protein
MTLKNTLSWALIITGLIAMTACGETGNESITTDVTPSSQIDSTQMATLSEGSKTQNGPPSEIMRQQAEGSDSDIDGHPQVNPNEKSVTRDVIVPPAVEGKWKAVKIMVRNKADEEKSKMQMVDLGSSFMIDGAPLKVTVGPFLPNFVMDRATYTSGGNELANPAVRLVIEEGDKTVFEGWAFAKFPGMYAFEHETYSLQLMDFIPINTS